MKLLEVVNRSAIPRPWSEGDNIPWDEPGFSERMLAEHLSQEHDAASRRFEVIDRHVTWIHQELLGGEGSRVLDLGCGPGLYAGRLARLGHACVGVDFSPASIAYARERAAEEELPVTYLHEDIREAEYGSGYDLVMLIYGEFNVFRPTHARAILTKARDALVPGGLLLLEPHTGAAVEGLAKAPPSWYTSKGGLFSPQPHLVLQENFWDDEAQAGTTRYYLVDAASGEVTPYAQSFQAYTEAGYREVVQDAGFEDITTYDALAGEPGRPEGTLFALTAKKR